MITLALAASLASGSPAVGAQIQGNPVCLPVTAQPGHSYPLGTVYVANAGSGTADFTLRATGPLPGQRLYRHVRPFPGSWLHVSYPSVLWLFHHSYVQLAAGQGTYLPVTVTIPAGTPSGNYGGNLLAGQGTSPPAGGGAGLGGDAGTDLEIGIGVKPPSCAALTPSARPETRQQADQAEAADTVAAATGRHLPGAAGYLIVFALVAFIGNVAVKAVRR